MTLLASVFSLYVCLLHVFIMIVEMSFWDKKLGLKMFALKQEFATKTKVLAANQGLYNGFLAAGLLWGLLHPDSIIGWQIQFFFLSCVVIAGMYGAYSSSIKILYVQGAPAAIGCILVTMQLWF